jgi:hypothetical protein
MDTLGGLVDKISIVNLKMWNNQEILYDIRRMTFEEFKERFIKNDDKVLELFESLKKCCDLNVQRNALIDEFDVRLIEIINAGLNGEDLDNGSNIQRKHKSY